MVHHLCSSLLISASLSPICPRHHRSLPLRHRSFLSSSIFASLSPICHVVVDLCLFIADLSPIHQSMLISLSHRSVSNSPIYDYLSLMPWVQIWAYFGGFVIWFWVVGLWFGFGWAWLVVGRWWGVFVWWSFVVDWWWLMVGGYQFYGLSLGLGLGLGLWFYFGFVFVCDFGGCGLRL